MNRVAKAFSFFIVCLLVAGSAVATEPGFKESIERLKLLYTPAAAPEGQAPVLPPVVIDTTEDGMLVLTQRTDYNRSQFNFKSSSEQTWRVAITDLDSKRIKVQTDPLGVYVPVKKDVARVMVERHEAKARLESQKESGEQWNTADKFMSSFIVIPATTPQQADEAAELIERIVKAAPKKD